MGAHPVRSQIPIGVAAVLPDAAQRVRDLESVLFSCFGQWGYREIIPPTFEYLDILSKGLPSEVIEKCYKFADWTTGRVLILRPDVTAQIARIVGMGMAGDRLPLRLCYRTTVFRYEEEHAGREREIFQVGVELIGEDTPAMDAEILSLLIDALHRIGVKACKISLGHVGFFQGLLANSRLSLSGRKEAELAAASKDIPKLESILERERIPSQDARVILEAPGRYGGEEVLDWGKAVAGRNRQLSAPLERLENVYRLLEAAGLSEYLLLDLGEFRGFDYYDGVVFDVFTDEVGSELGGGGRYNHLIGQFGREVPSTGFALNVDKLFSAITHNESMSLARRERVLVVCPLGSYGTGSRLARDLREAGFSVILETMGTLRSMTNRAVMRRGAGERVACFIGVSGVASNKSLLTTCGAGQRRARVRTVLLTEVPSVLQEVVHAVD